MQENIPESIRAAALKLPAIRVAARRLRLPLTEAGLRRNPPVPDARNAASLYRQADTIARRKSKAAFEADLKTLSDCLKLSRSLPSLATSRIALSRNNDLLRLANEAASRLDCDFQRDFRRGPYTPFPEYATMRNLARILAVQALLQVEAKNPMAALSSIQNGITIARHVGQDAFLIAYLVRMAILALMDVPFRQVLWQFGNRPDVLKRSAQINRLCVGLTDPRPALRTEAFIGVWVGEHVRKGEEFSGIGTSPFRRQLSKSHQRKVFADAWETRLLEFWTTTIPEMERPETTLRIMDKTLSRGIGHQVRAVEGASPDYSYTLAAILHPVYADAAKKGMQTEAFIRIRNIAIEALMQAATTRRFPDRLPQVAGASDPFTDRPLLYRRSGSGFLVYSVSTNGKDDRGNEEKTEGNFTQDIVFRYP